MVCRLLFVVCRLPLIVCSLWFVFVFEVRCSLLVACCSFHVVRDVLFVVCCVVVVVLWLSCGGCWLLFVVRCVKLS